MERIVHIETRPECTLYVEFDDGTTGEYSLRDRLVGPMLEPLRDAVFFAKVRLDEWGVPVWPNGADVAPDAIHDVLSRETRAESAP